MMRAEARDISQTIIYGVFPKSPEVIKYSQRKLTTSKADAILLALSDEERAGVKTLNLSDNQLDAIPGSVRLLVNLESLVLAKNHIEELPEWIGSLTSLMWLNVHNNRIELIPRSIGNLVNLGGLLFDANLLTRLPSSVSKLTNLKLLNLTFNYQLPEDYRINSSSPITTQQLLHKIAVDEWSASARDATAVWILGGHQTPVHRDVRNMISGMIYATYRDEGWEEVAEEAESKDKIKKAKI